MPYMPNKPYDQMDQSERDYMEAMLRYDNLEPGAGAAGYEKSPGFWRQFFGITGSDSARRDRNRERGRLDREGTIRQLQQKEQQRLAPAATAMVQPKSAPPDAITPEKEASDLAALLGQLNKITHNPNEFVGPQEAAGLEQQRIGEFNNQQQQDSNLAYANYVGTPRREYFTPGMNAGHPELSSIPEHTGFTAPGGERTDTSTKFGARPPSEDEMRGIRRFGGGYASRVAAAQSEQMDRRLRMSRKKNRQAGLSSGDSLRQALLSFAPTINADRTDALAREAWMKDPAIMSLLQAVQPQEREADSILNMALNRAGSFVG